MIMIMTMIMTMIMIKSLLILNTAMNCYERALARHVV